MGKPFLADVYGIERIIIAVDTVVVVDRKTRVKRGELSEEALQLLDALKRGYDYMRQLKSQQGREHANAASEAARRAHHKL